MRAIEDLLLLASLDDLLRSVLYHLKCKFKFMKTLQNVLVCFFFIEKHQYRLILVAW